MTASRRFTLIVLAAGTSLAAVSLHAGDSLRTGDDGLQAAYYEYEDARDCRHCRARGRRGLAARCRERICCIHRHLGGDTCRGHAEAFGDSVHDALFNFGDMFVALSEWHRGCRRWHRDLRRDCCSPRPPRRHEQWR